MSKRDQLFLHLKNLPDDAKSLLAGINLAQQYVAILRAQKITLDSETLKLAKYKTELQKQPSDISELKVNLANLYANLLVKTPGMSPESTRGGIAVMIFLGACTALLFALAFAYQENFDAKILSIPLYVYVWGIMGTLAYLIWACVSHIAFKDFDNYYIPWYVFRIPLGAMMAAIIYLIFVAGMATFNLSEQTEAQLKDNPFPIWVLSFVAGFSIRYSMNTLDRVTNSLMPNTQDTKTKKLSTELT